MRKTIKLFFVLIMSLTPTVQIAAMESENERFKQELLEEIRAEIKDLSPAEIRTIINEVEQSMTEYIEHYEETPKEQLLTKDEVYLQQHRHEVSPQNFSMLQTQSDKSEDERILEELNPKLKMLSKEDYHYDEEKGEIEFDVSKDKVFYAQENTMVQASLWQLLSVGDILINFDNGTLGKHFGHAALMWLKSSTVRESKTIEAPRYGDYVRIMSYDSWHNNYENRITYNYVPSIYKTNLPALAAMNAMERGMDWHIH